jgi:hypothetical protein
MLPRPNGRARQVRKTSHRSKGALPQENDNNA